MRKIIAAIAPTFGEKCWAPIFCIRSAIHKASKICMKVTAKNDPPDIVRIRAINAGYPGVLKVSGTLPSIENE